MTTDDDLTPRQQSILDALADAPIGLRVIDISDRLKVPRFEQESIAEDLIALRRLGHVYKKGTGWRLCRPNRIAP